MPMQGYCRLYIIHFTEHVITNPMCHIPNIGLNIGYLLNHGRVTVERTNVPFGTIESILKNKRLYAKSVSRSVGQSMTKSQFFFFFFLFSGLAA